MLSSSLIAAHDSCTPLRRSEYAYHRSRSLVNRARSPASIDPARAHRVVLVAARAGTIESAVGGQWSMLRQPLSPADPSPVIPHREQTLLPNAATTQFRHVDPYAVIPPTREQSPRARTDARPVLAGHVHVHCLKAGRQDRADRSSGERTSHRRRNGSPSSGSARAAEERLDVSGGEGRSTSRGSERESG